VEEEGAWVREYPVTLMQFLMFLYHNHADIAPLFMTPDFICALVSTLFKYRTSSEANSEITSPVEDFKVLLTYFCFISLFENLSAFAALPRIRLNGAGQDF
jgi:hypothetical protein